MKQEIEKLENENTLLEQSKDKLALDLKEYKNQCERNEKRVLDSEQIWLQKERTWEESLSDLKNKLNANEKALQKKVKECQDLMSINQKLNDSLMSKNKEYGKLNDGILTSNFKLKKRKINS